jgi:two-component system NtrC family sensor kinase
MSTMADRAVEPRRAPSWAKRRLSLRAQGLVLHALGVGLIIFYAFFVIGQRGELHRHYTELDGKQKFEERLYHLSADLGRIDQDFDDAADLSAPVVDSPVAREKLKAVHRNLAVLVSEIGPLLDDYPDVRDHIDALPKAFAVLDAEFGRDTLVNLSIKMHTTSHSLETLIERVQQDRRDLSEGYINIYLGNTATSAIVSVLALCVLGSFAVFFFARLTNDIRKLSESAKKIERGLYVPQLEVNRHDELGELMEAMNSMAATLKERERQLAISRQQYFHEQKMVAIGSLSAGVAHEIGNPISSITVLTEAIVEAKSRHDADLCRRQCKPELILDQIRRISAITRELSNLAAPRPPDLQLADINELIRNACNFVRYDRRYGSLVELHLELDSQLPAVLMVADQFVQVILNLLFNAADSFAGRSGQPNRVTVSSRQTASAIEVRVADNGAGMDQETLSHAFDAFFTTKPEGQGTGLGLAVSQSLIEALGGTLTLESTHGVGTTAKICLPHPKGRAS